MNEIKLKINKKYIFICIAFLFCFEPKLAVKYTLINDIYIFGAIIFFLIMLLKYIKNNQVSKTFCLLILFRISFFFQTLMSNGDIMMWGYMSLVLLMLCMIFDIYIKKDRDIVLKAMIDVLCILLLINLIIVFLYPNGIIDGIYFIGIRTRISDVIFPLIAFSLIYDVLNGKNYSIRTLACIGISILNIIKLSVTTALVGIAFFLLMYFCFCRFSKMRKILNLRVIVYIGVAISFLFTFGNVYTYFKNFIVNFLHKEATLSSRTFIWNEAVKYIANSPIFGHGIAKNGNFVYWGYTGGIKSLWQAHNNWLQLLYDGGIFSMIIFLGFININSKKLKYYKDEKTTAILLVTVAIFFLMMIAEIFIYTPYFYLIIFAMANIEYLVTKKGEKLYEKS